MIGRLRGILVSKQPPWLVLEVGGVGYELEAPMSTFFDLPEIGREVALFTHYAVKEDTVALYGFRAERERVLFRNLQQGQRHRREDRAGGIVRGERRRVRAAGAKWRCRRAVTHPRHRQEDRRAHGRGVARSRRRHGPCSAHRAEAPRPRSPRTRRPRR